MGTYRHREPALFMPPANAVPARIDYHDFIVNALAQRRTQLGMALESLTTRATVLTEVAMELVETLRSGHKVLVAGNGGSAAQAQHLAAELVGRFKRERAPYAVISLSTDLAIITAVSNDYGYQDVFARQVRALGQPGDLLMAFSTSGESENLLRAAQAGREGLLTVIAVTGEQPSRLERVADMTIRVPLVDTATVQELHMVVIHILCDLAESRLSVCENGGNV
ncbi:MAG TPA: SIS domain-containing protein [Ktedonobacteraceae bacterium]|nr:SIS domain-containing protein [Ktedonobacteraceae bacterium]